MSLLVTFVAILLAIISFGVLAIAPAVIATLLGRRARRELRDDSPAAAQRLAAIAWWMSVIAMALALVALAVLLLDVARVGEVGDRLVERAR
jgi:cytochrome c biogenesis protein CcdA